MSGPSNHSMHKKYSSLDDTNDPPALAKALQHISISDPEATHAVFKDEQKRWIKVPRFTTHTVPDLTANTRVVAVVGIQQKVADPQTDGWFLSDFFAFWNVLNGMTNTQTWLHCLDLDDLVTRHTRYLHGNPFKERKVVLDAEILAKAKQSQHCPQQIKETLLIRTFHKCIKSECQAAKEAGNQSVLILMFGHGDRNTSGIFLGSERNVFSIKMFEKATQGMDVNVTILSTACYSGGWACAPRINTTTLAAAGRKNVSRAWTYSGSTGRACGSMFTTAIIDKMTKAESSSRSVLSPSDDEPVTPAEGEDETYREFAESVFESLLKEIDRRGFQHGLTFSAQDDAWEMHWSDRTGIPMANFKGRWDELQDWPADVTLLWGDFQNRDPHVTAEERAHFVAERDADKGIHEWVGYLGSRGSATAGSVLGKRKTSGLNDLTPEALLNKVRNLGMIYLESYKGNECTGNDGALHQLLYLITTGQETDPLKLENAYQQIRYRMEQMSTADSYLESMDISRPKDLQCHEYDTNGVNAEIPGEKHDKIMSMVMAHDCLFPKPIDRQGNSFSKGSLYLEVALHHSGLSLEVIQQKLDGLAQGVNEDLHRRQELLRKDEDVSSKRQKLRKFYPNLSK